jgi:hypothetical protein
MDARNRAIAALAEALKMLQAVNNLPAMDGEAPELPSIRINISPIGLTGADAEHCHSIDITPHVAQTIADAIDSTNPYALNAAAAIDENDMAGPKARFMAWLQGQTGETIVSGEWSAAAIAQCDPALYADVTDIFMLLDPTAITKKVLDDAHVDNLAVNRALDDWFGEIPDPTLAELYRDEDDL